MEKKEQEMGNISTHRVITLLDRKEMEFLDKLGKDALFSTGHKLTYNEILRGLVDLALETGVSGEKVDSSETLKTALFAQLRSTVEGLKKKD